MMSSSMANPVLVDANIIVAAVLPGDPHHKKIIELVKRYAQKSAEFVTNHLIQSEALTVTLMRSKSMTAVQLLDARFFIPGAIIVPPPIPAVWLSDIMHVFLSQKKYKGEFLSYADASLIVQARKQRIRTILTFDETFGQFNNEFDLPCVSKK